MQFQSNDLLNLLIDRIFWVDGVMILKIFFKSWDSLLKNKIWVRTKSVLSNNFTSIRFKVLRRVSLSFMRKYHSNFNKKDFDRIDPYEPKYQ